MTEDNRSTYQRLMREYKALIQRKKRNYHLAIASDVKHLHECDPQGYWRFWKRYKPSHRNYDLLDAETFTEYYKNLGNKPDNSLFDNQFMENIDDCMSRYDGEILLNTNTILDDILNAPISIDETKAPLKYMKVNKAAGTDGIPSEFYKYTCNTLDQPWTALFNNVLKTGSYSSTWCEGLINPLHKRDSPTLPDNYRKITITPAIGKLFDGILNNRLQFAKECLSTGDPFQNGFKPNSRAIDNIFLLNGIIEKCKANGRPLYMFHRFQICFWFDKPVSPSFQTVESGMHWEILFRDPKHVPKCDISCEMGWPAWWNVWKYVRSSTGWSIKPEFFQFISWRPPCLSKYRKGCIYWRHTHCLSVVCWRSGINVEEPNRFAKFNPWAGKLLYAVAYGSESHED